MSGQQLENITDEEFDRYMNGTEKKKTYCFDIDGTLCTNTEGKYEEASPFPERIAIVNSFYEKGNHITLFTARRSTTKIDWREITEKQLKKWNVKYHELVFGKPYYDIYIGDKAINDKTFF